MNAREVAFELLTRWSRSRRFADELLEQALAEAKLPAADRALVMELFYGCLRQKLALEFLISQIAGKAPRRSVATILELGLYQVVFMRMPVHAAVHETVELAKRHVSPAEAKFVNAVLRKANPQLLERADPWVRLSHPRWLWERHGEAWCQWNNQPPPTYVRGDKPWPAVLEPTSFHALCYRVIDAERFFQSPGRYYVQDPSTLMAVDVLDPQPGESVLDMCAAPGGKATYIAEKMQNRGRIIAADSSNSRLGLVAENCKRLGVTIVATLACEGTRLDGCLRGEQFDRVLVDAPCSNTGVMRRRPDLRWRIEEKEIARLAALQLKLLAKAAEFTKPGGVLVYSTCSLEAEENERVVEQFLGGHPEFALEATRSLFPSRDEVDGAFVARLGKR
ncbi:MAG TPA: transcription antitermination factor NusB [Verrucomicrobiae bacterium]|nr:transcription antitermination factor NusB [Verrucomicrobiae bacterium]